MNKIQVDLGEQTHSICIGRGILDSLGTLLSKEKIGKRCAIITNPTVNKLHGSHTKKILESSGFDVVILEIPDSETSKSLKQAEKLYVELLENKLDRTSCIIALGGGVVGDLAGFVAATFMRGISVVQVPTTLLAQVDSSIGGKVGVDLPKGKNLVGAFHQPKLILSDINTLKTLPDTELKSGLSEIIKCAIISDVTLFKLLEKNIEKIEQRDPGTLTEIITRCSRIKVDVIEKDEKEQGKRVILNLGHTLGHALEAVTNYTVSHGEAVAIGIVFAARLSNKLDMLTANDLGRIVNLMQDANLPVKIKKSVEIDKLMEAMQHDKKARDGKLRFVLPRKIGDVVITDNVPKNLIRKTLEEMKK